MWPVHHVYKNWSIGPNVTISTDKNIRGYQKPHCTSGIKKDIKQITHNEKATLYNPVNYSSPFLYNATGKRCPKPPVF